jgi:hypothetical protein
MEWSLVFYGHKLQIGAEICIPKNYTYNPTEINHATDKDYLESQIIFHYYVDHFTIYKNTGNKLCIP